MATIDEVFETMSAYDNGFEYLTINPDTRMIEIPKNELLFGVAGDNNSERKYFMCPRYVGDNLDVSKCYVQINFNNGHDDPDGYLVTDLALADGVVTFSWLIDDKVVAYKGEVEFSVNISDGERDWNTTTATGTSLISLAADVSNVTSKTSNVVAQLREMVDAQTAAVEVEGTTQIANVQNAASEATTEAQTQIEAKGAATLESIPDDYTETYNTANKALRTRANAIVGTAEGEVIRVTDSSDDYLRGMRIFGKSTQVTTTGKNLLNIEETVTLSNVRGIDVALDAGTYIVSVTSETHSGDQYPYLRFYNNNVWIQLKDGLAQSAVLSQPETTVYIYTYGMSASESVGVTASFNQLMISTSGGDYEPYSGGVASPSPEYPQDIVSVENLKVGVYGKNLITSFVDSDKTHNGVTFTVNDDQSITINGTATEASLFNMVTLYETSPIIHPGAEYIISGATSAAAIQVYEWCGTWSQRASTSGEKAFTLSTNASGVLIRYVVNPGITVDNLTVYPMLRLVSDSDNAYEQAKMDQTFELDYALPGIPVTSGGNYTDANGQQWICDEIDFERGVYIQRIGVGTLTGEEIWKASQLQDGSEYIRYDAAMTSLPRCVLDVYNAYCTHFPAVPAPNQNGFWTHDLGTVDYLAVRIKWNYTSAEELTTYLADQYAAGTPVTFSYILATPIETALTEADIYNFSQLHSNYPTTTVLNDADTHMELSYNKDSTIVIQKLVDAITALGGTV